MTNIDHEKQMKLERKKELINIIMNEVNVEVISVNYTHSHNITSVLLLLDGLNPNLIIEPYMSGYHHGEPDNCELAADTYEQMAVDYLMKKLTI